MTEGTQKVILFPNTDYNTIQEGNLFAMVTTTTNLPLDLGGRPFFTPLSSYSTRDLFRPVILSIFSVFEWLCYLGLVSSLQSCLRHERGESVRAFLFSLCHAICHDNHKTIQ